MTDAWNEAAAAHETEQELRRARKMRTHGSTESTAWGMTPAGSRAYVEPQCPHRALATAILLASGARFLHQTTPLQQLSWKQT